MKIVYFTIFLISLHSISVKAQNVFSFNGLADVNLRFAPRGSGGRAIVHDDNNILTLNFGGDFTGGTKIGGSFFLQNDGRISIPDAASFSGANFMTNDYSTMTFTSRAWQSAQGINGKAFSFMTHNNSGGSNIEMMSIYYGESGKILLAPNGGDVGIGTQKTNGYKLAVAGSVIAESIKVQLRAAWPDYIFSKEYLLPSLLEIESYIIKNGHLQGIPSAIEVNSNGLDLGNISAKLLQKIEELTLHLIEKDKALAKEKALNQNQELRIKELEVKFKNFIDRNNE